jgi:hypothetical protein
VKLAAGLALVAGCTVNCANLLGPSCLAQQKTGNVASIGGIAAAGTLTPHVVAYDTRGSQNNVRVSWTAQGEMTGPRMYFYATSTACVNFTAPPTDGSPDPNTGACQTIGHAGGTLAPYARDCARNNTCSVHAGDIVQRSLIVTGPGNGQPADFREYKLWVVADPVATNVSYQISITWFSGPDC